MGKIITLVLKIAAVIFCILAFLLTNKDAWDIIKIAAFIVAVGLPIDASLLIKVIKTKLK